jgi:hypothetical protein
VNLRIVALLSLALGCGEPPPLTCSEGLFFEGAAAHALEVRSEGGTSWTDGAEVPLELGGQGGYMVQPVLMLDPTLLPAGTLGEPLPERLCARVEIDNVDPTGGDRFNGFTMLTLPVRLERNPVTGRYESPTLANQLRWSPLPPGTEYRFTAVARFETFAASVTRDLRFR